MKRRTFLAWLAASLVAGVGLLFMKRRWLKERLLATPIGQRARDAILGVDAEKESATLTQDDETGLLKLADAVLPSNAGEASHAVVLDRLRWQATTGLGYAYEFRRTLALLNEETQNTYGKRFRFTQLAAPQAEAVVGTLLEGIVAYQLSAASTGDVVRLVVSPRFRERYRMRRLCRERDSRRLLSVASRVGETRLSVLPGRVRRHRHLQSATRVRERIRRDVSRPGDLNARCRRAVRNRIVRHAKCRQRAAVFRRPRPCRTRPRHRQQLLHPPARFVLILTHLTPCACRRAR